MNLVIDLGNTQAKVAVFSNTDLVFSKSYKRITVKGIDKIINRFSIQKSILCSVVSNDSEIINLLTNKTTFINFHTNLKLPIINKYKTPKTLGADRLVNALAARFKISNSNNLIIDAGTCIKFDFINNKNEYLGGSISPGIAMRFKALQKFTAKLPLVATDYNYNKLIGDTTENSIKTGVLTGVLAEVEGLIERYKKEYKKLNIIITGGDASFFESNLKCSIFADSNHLLKGLNQIINND